MIRDDGSLGISVYGVTTQPMFQRLFLDMPEQILFGMIYLKSINAKMKTKIHAIRISYWIMLGIALFFASLALNQTQPKLQELTATSAALTGTAVTTAEADDGAGSTDGIMFVAVMIVLIVILPILLKRRAWINGKRNRTAPPS